MKRLLMLGLVLVAAGACRDSPAGPPPPTPGLVIVPSLGVGQVYTVPDHGTGVRVQGGPGDAEYALIPFVSSTTAPSTRTVNFNVTGAGIHTVSSSTSAEPGGLFSRHSGAAPAAEFRHEFERRLREREARELTPLLVPGPAGEDARLQASRSLAPASAPAVGAVMQFNVNSTEPCANPDHRHGRVVAVTERAVVVADTANPGGPGTFTTQDYQGFGETFDQLVWPTIVQNFGAPHDVDNNERVIIFFTRAVNELTPRNQDWFVGGFFFARDLFPRTAQQGFQACEASNYAEMFYMLVPDPQGAVNGNVRLIDRELRSTVGVIAHEFQHLINASRRLYVVRTGGSAWNEETWLNEGLSHIAEELMAYASSTLAPRQNIDADRLLGSGDQEAFFSFQNSNISRLASYLENPDTTSLIGNDGLATRGAAWLFLRYAADRRVGTGSQHSFWRGLIDTDATGLGNLRAAIGAEPMDWVRDWAAATFAADLVPGLESRFALPSWNLRSIYPRLLNRAGMPIYGRYPLLTRPLTDQTTLSLSIRAGSAAYLTFGVRDGATAEVSASGPGETALDSAVRFNLVRIR